MNELVSQLADQAKNSVPRGVLDPDMWIAEYNRIFAELIVQECAEQSMSIGRYNTPSGITPDLSIAIAVGLKKHFGVEE